MREKKCLNGPACVFRTATDSRIALYFVACLFESLSLNWCISLFAREKNAEIEREKERKKEQERERERERRKSEREGVRKREYAFARVKDRKENARERERQTQREIDESVSGRFEPTSPA